MIEKCEDIILKILISLMLVIYVLKLPESNFVRRVIGKVP